MTYWQMDRQFWCHRYGEILDYKILCTIYCQEVELCLKSFLPYLLKGEKEADPTMPQKLKPHFPSISEIPAPKKLRKVSFPQAPPISSITSSTRLGDMVEATSPTPREGTQEQNPPQQTWSTRVKDSNNFCNTPDSDDEISTYRRPKGRLKPHSTILILTRVEATINLLKFPFNLL